VLRRFWTATGEEAVLVWDEKKGRKTFNSVDPLEITPAAPAPVADTSTAEVLAGTAFPEIGRAIADTQASIDRAIAEGQARVRPHLSEQLADWSGRNIPTLEAKRAFSAELGAILRLMHVKLECPCGKPSDLQVVSSSAPGSFRLWHVHEREACPDGPGVGRGSIVPLLKIASPRASA
jgi:hypothetical protein